ncbi:MAG: DUF2167 domain-containing protein [Pseudomonadota bacterium]
MSVLRVLRNVLRSGSIALFLMVGAGGAIASEPAEKLVYTPGEGEELTAEQTSNIEAFLERLQPMVGEVTLPAAKATLDVPDAYYFLDADGARAVLEEAWGNPPDENVLGMIFPAGATPLDYGVWGATIHYSGDGYVSDKDAQKINYAEMMTDLQEATNSENPWRVENGYEPVQLVGWAEAPTYDGLSNKMYWAKELKFGDAPVNTLNYDIRVLGRGGALVISFIADMNALPSIRETAPTVLAMANFDPGATYADYQPGVDRKAAYGLAGLVGGAAIAKKTGLLAAIILFGKKFIGVIAIGAVAAFGALRKMISGK